MAELEVYMRRAFWLRRVRSAAVGPTIAVVGLLVTYAIGKLTLANALLQVTAPVIGYASGYASGRLRRWYRLRPRRIVLAPGWRLRGLLSVVLGARFSERVTDQIFADAAHDWLEAHQAGRRGLARWIYIRCYISIVEALLATVVLRLATLVGTVVRSLLGLR